jgi:hypothetical protein
MFQQKTVSPPIGQSYTERQGRMPTSALDNQRIGRSITYAGAQGTLDVIVLRSFATMGPQHAYGIAARFAVSL